MEEGRRSYRWIVVALLLVNIFAFFLSINSIPPLFKEIGKEISISKTDMGLIIGVTFIAALFFSFIGGGISDRIGSKWAIGGSVIIVALFGTLRSITGSSYGLVVCMFLMGIGSAIILPNVPKVLGTWFESKQLATANGICLIGMPLGGAVGMGISAGILSPALGGWRNVMIALGGVTFITGILWMVLFKDIKVHRADEIEKKSIRDNFKKVLRIKDIWWASVYSGFNMAGVLAVVSLLPHSLSERGITEARSGALVAIMLSLSTIFKVVGGIISDRLGRRKPVLVICAIVQGASTFAFGIFTGIPLIVALIFSGISMGMIPPVLLAIPVEIKEVGSALAATAAGLIFMIGNIGGFLGPIVSGKIMDVTGSDGLGFLFMGFILILGSLFILPVRETGQGKKQ